MHKISQDIKYKKYVEIYVGYSIYILMAEYLLYIRYQVGFLRRNARRNLYTSGSSLWYLGERIAMVSVGCHFKFAEGVLCAGQIMVIRNDQKILW